MSARYGSRQVAKGDLIAIGHALGLEPQELLRLPTCDVYDRVLTAAQDLMNEHCCLQNAIDAERERRA